MIATERYLWNCTTNDGGSRRCKDNVFTPSPRIANKLHLTGDNGQALTLSPPTYPGNPLANALAENGIPKSQDKPCGVCDAFKAAGTASSLGVAAAQILKELGATIEYGVDATGAPKMIPLPVALVGVSAALGVLIGSPIAKLAYGYSTWEALNLELKFASDPNNSLTGEAELLGSWALSFAPYIL